MTATFRPLLAAALLTAALTACEDPYKVEPNFEVASDTFVVYGINEAPIGAPTAVSLFASVSGVPAIAATAAFNFDFAVDIAADGRITLIPNTRVANGMVGTHRVGLQQVDSAFALLTHAPATGYKYDSLLVITAGQTVAIQSADPVACPVSYLGTQIYGKFVVDSLLANPARAYIRTTIDPNCDFRSLLPGLPED